MKIIMNKGILKLNLQITKGEGITGRHMLTLCFKIKQKEKCDKICRNEKKIICKDFFRKSSVIWAEVKNTDKGVESNIIKKS